MVADKRADIAAMIPGVKILVEIKRDFHAYLWTAAEQQLDRFYTRDPEARGFGVYAVFWFGERRGQSIPAPPGGLARACFPADLEQMLRDRLPIEKRARIAVIVIDVSGPLTVTWPRPA